MSSQIAKPFIALDQIHGYSSNREYFEKGVN